LIILHFKSHFLLEQGKSSETELSTS